MNEHYERAHKEIQDAIGELEIASSLILKGYAVPADDAIKAGMDRLANARVMILRARGLDIKDISEWLGSVPIADE